MQEIVSVYVLRDHDVIHAISIVASVPEYAFNMFALCIKKFLLYFRFVIYYVKKNFICYANPAIQSRFLFHHHKTFHRS